jgi:hypothetical protein
VSVLNLRELIEDLEDLAEEFGDDAEVRLAQQPRWAFEYSLGRIAGTKGRPAKGNREATPACIYLGEGSQLGYLPQAAAVALDWSASGDEDEDDDEEDLAEDFPGQRITGPEAPPEEEESAIPLRPDFDTRDREGRDDFCDACQQHRPCSCDEPKGAK